MRTLVRNHTFILLAFLFLGGCLGDSKEIQIVKNGHFNNYPSKPIGEAVDQFFGNPTWESGTGIDGETKGKTLVNVGGRMTYMEKEVQGKIQFVVNKETGVFEIQAFEMNGIPQNRLMMAALLEKMFQ